MKARIVKMFVMFSNFDKYHFKSNLSLPLILPTIEKVLEKCFIKMFLSVIDKLKELDKHKSYAFEHHMKM